MIADHYRSTVDYIKCIRANPLSGIGYATMIAGAVLTFQDYDNLFINTSAVSVAFIAYAFARGVTRETYRTYRKTLKHIKKRNTIKPKFIRQKSEIYCNKKGLELAAKEAGLEDLIERSS